MAATATNIAANNTEDVQNRRRYLLLGKIRTDGERYLTLKLHDEQHTWHNIPLGKVKPTDKGIYDKDKNVIVPIFPLLHSTVEKKDNEYRNVQQGWIYVFINGYLWRELQVVSRAMLTDVNLRYEQGKNVRKATGERDFRILVPHKIDGKVNDIRIAYSEVQWSWSYIYAMGGMDKEKDTRYREELHSGKAYGKDYTKHSKNVDQYNMRLDKIDLSDYQNNFKNKVLSSNDAAVVLNIKDLEGKLKNKPEIKLHINGEFAAVILNDPIGVAHNYATQLNHKWNEMHSLLASLETGIKPGIKQTVAPDLASQIKAQFDMAVIMYQAGFSNAKNQDTYGDDLNKQRLEMLLAVKERKILRNEIKQLRDKLVKAVKADAYQKALIDYTSNVPEKQLAGKATVAYHNQYVALHPHEYDLHLDIPENITDDINERDEAWEYLADTLVSKNDAGALLYVQIKGNIFDITSKLNAVLGKILEGFRKLTVVDVGYLRAATYIINSFKYLGMVEVEVKQVKFNQVVPKGYRVVDKRFSDFVEKITVKQQVLGYPDLDGIARVQFGEAQLFIFPPGTNVSQTGSEISVSRAVRHVDLIVEKEKPLNRFLKGIESTQLYSKGFLSVIGVVETINFASAVHQIKSKGLDVRETANLVGAMAGTLNFFIEWKKLRLEMMKRPPIKFVSFMANATGRIAPLLGAVVSGLDSYSNFKARDYDAALWHTGAAISSLLLVAIASGGMIVLPIFLIAFGIFCGIMASLAEDDPLEIFAKNAHFQEDGGIAVGGNLWEKIRNQAGNPIYSKKEFDRWKDLGKARDELFNIMYGIVPYLAVTYDKSTIKDYYKTIITKATKIRAKVAFKRFELVSSRLDYRLRVYPNGFKSIYKDNKPYVELRPNEMDYTNNDEFGGIKHILMTFDLPQILIDDLGDESEIMFLCRELINTKTDQFMPMPSSDGEFRFYAVRRPGTKGFVKGNAYGESVYESNTYRTRYGKDRRMGKLKQLEDPKFWA